LHNDALKGLCSV